MEDMKLGKLTADDLNAIAGCRLNKSKYQKWVWASFTAIVIWALMVALVHIAVFDDDEDEQSYKVYEIREHIVVFDQMPSELPTHELKLYRDGDLEYMGVRYASSYTENYDGKDYLALILLIVIPLVIWFAGYMYMLFIWDREKRDFVDANCEVIIS